MLAKQKNQNSLTVRRWRVFWVLPLLLGVLAAGVQAQTNSKKAALPVWQEYKGIKIGLTADEVRAKLGKAQSDDKDGFLYVFPEDESAQILVGADQKVRTISVMYGSECLKAPKFEDIFGTAVHPEPQTGGAINKLIKYTEAGYWVSYNRLAGDKPSVMVIMQKLP